VRMSVWNRLFKDHPATVNETYWQHFGAAMSFSLRMFWGGLVCFVHAIVPGAFCTTGSDMIRELHERMVINRRRQADRQAAAIETRKAA